MKITYSMDTWISVSFGTKLCTDVFWVEICMNTHKFVWVGISGPWLRSPVEESSLRYGYRWTPKSLNHTMSGASDCRPNGMHQNWWLCLASCACWPSTDVVDMELRDLGQLYGASLMDDLQQLQDRWCPTVCPKYLLPEGKE